MATEKIGFIAARFQIAPVRNKVNKRPYSNDSVFLLKRQEHVIVPSPISEVLLNDGVRYAHLLTIAIGFGISFLADANVFRHLRAPLNGALISTLHWYHSIVTFALMGMWMSGLALIYMRTGFVLENFSPKLIAKIIVVLVLTLNSLAINRYAIPCLAGNLDKTLMQLPFKIMMPMALVSGASTTSWLFALSLGSSVFLKPASAEFYMLLIPASYLVGVLLSLVGLIAARAASKAKTPRTA